MVALDPRPRWRGGHFIWRPDQHRRQAALLEHDVATRGDRQLSAGLLLSQLAVQHRNLAKMIEARQATGVVTFSGWPPYIESPPLCP
jgi:hypothetical protein